MLETRSHRSHKPFGKPKCCLMSNPSSPLHFKAATLLLQNFRSIWVGEDLQDHQIQAESPHSPRCHIHTSPGYLQGWDTPTALRTPLRTSAPKTPPPVVFHDHLPKKYARYHLREYLRHHRVPSAYKGPKPPYTALSPGVMEPALQPPQRAPEHPREQLCSLGSPCASEGQEKAQGAAKAGLTRGPEI